MEKPFIGELSAETRWCIELMRALEPGEILSYEAIAVKVGVPVEDLRGSRRHIITNAKRKVLREDGIVVRCVSTIGYKRLPPDEIPKAQESRIAHVRRESLTGIREMASPDCDGLQGEALQKRNFYLSGFGVLAHITKRKNLRKLQEAATAQNAHLNAGETLRLFAAPRERKQPPKAAN